MENCPPSLLLLPSLSYPLYLPAWEPKAKRQKKQILPWATYTAWPNCPVETPLICLFRFVRLFAPNTHTHTTHADTPHTTPITLLGASQICKVMTADLTDRFPRYFSCLCAAGARPAFSFGTSPPLLKVCRRYAIVDH